MTLADDPLPDEVLLSALRQLGLLRPGEVARLTPLTGGVSSDIHLVQADGRAFCVKRALPRLKVTALWEAPVGRNAAEADWLRSVAAFAPDWVPALLGELPEAGLFAMEYLPPEDFPVWKTRLMQGEADPTFAAAVGRALATIHGRTAGNPGLAARFAHDATFEAIRIEPYLRAAARHHPALAPQLSRLAETTLATKRALVHGDVSPKNLLCGPRGPVFLDAECAWYGDPAFDLAFCLNHLVLKGAWRWGRRMDYLACFDALARAYLAGVSWEDQAEFEARCAALLPGLLLARVDGKSPVEYLQDDAARDTVREAASTLLRRPASSLAGVAELWAAA